ncbi:MULTISPECIES: hypothetical protein [Nguyenibacter]|uniref:Uncharacterized protein n=1 Tax=Nguyenibacter vanlangensis TaxID=1216886 RepID=A0ABZ3D7I7_9PROT|nr:hypothetical protein [Nguyenibacter sp. L1]WRH88386.1 hypothetical protein QN315_01730 [Nguyenibacter sp. L1]
MMQGRGVKQGPLPGSPGAIFRGMVLLGRGRRDGMNCFGATADSVLTALAPRVALWLVGSLLTLAHAPTAINGTKVLLSLCLVLAPTLVTHQLAQLWGRQALWPRYITAALWCDWLVLFIMLGTVAILGTVLGMVLPRGIGAIGAGVILNGVVIVYNLWLTWFVARVGLALGAWRAVLLVLAIVAVFLALSELSVVLPPHYAPWQDFLAMPPPESR